MSCADDGSSGTLRSVVAAAATGDTVDLTSLACGTISLLTGQIEVHVDDLTINGPGRDALTIDGNYNGRVFHHDGSGTLTLSGLTIIHGIADSDSYNPGYVRSAYGGCILSDNGTDFSPGEEGSVTIIDSVVSECRTYVHPPYDISSHGGGVHANRALTIQNSTISNCRIDFNASGSPMIGGGGGGVFARGPMEISNSQLVGNVARTTANTQMRGGAISSYGGAIITNSVITGNFAGCDSTKVTCHLGIGGGIDAGIGNGLVISTSTISDNVAEGSQSAAGGGIWSATTTSITGSAISGNVAQGADGFAKGGGIYLYDSYVSLSATTIANNAAGIGGGISARPNHPVNITNSTLSGNSATVVGGAIYTTASSALFVLSNSTITLNVSTGNRGGGGIVDLHDNLSGTTDFESSIVAGNINTVGGATYDADLGLTPYDPIITGANNLIIAANGVTLPPDTLNADPMLGPLQDNGGPTWTHALPAESPAIDAGNNVANLDSDQRGPDFIRVSGARADIGAFEAQSTSNDVIFTNGFDAQ